MDVTASVDTTHVDTAHADTTPHDTEPDDTEPLVRFDDDPVAAAAQLVPRYGYEEAERIVETAVRTHRRLDSFVQG